MMGNEELDFLRIIEQKLRDSGIVELIQSEVQNRPALWGQDKEKTCWLTDCSIQVCFNVKDKEQIAEAKPFFMFNMGTVDNVHISMSVHGDREYTTVHFEKEVVYDSQRNR